MSEGTKGRGLSSMGLLRETPGGRKGLARESARREGGEQLPLTAGAGRYTYTTEKMAHWVMSTAAKFSVMFKWPYALWSH